MTPWSVWCRPIWINMKCYSLWAANLKIISLNWLWALHNGFLVLWHGLFTDISTSWNQWHNVYRFTARFLTPQRITTMYPSSRGSEQHILHMLETCLCYVLIPKSHNNITHIMLDLLNITTKQSTSEWNHFTSNILASKSNMPRKKIIYIFSQVK